VHERSVKKGWEDRIPRNAHEFAEVYKKSEAYQRNLEDIKDLEAELQEQRHAWLAQNGAKKMKKKNYTLPFYKQVIACTQRQFLVMTGDRPSLIGKWGLIIFQVGPFSGLVRHAPSFSLTFLGLDRWQSVLQHAQDQRRRFHSGRCFIFFASLQHIAVLGRNDGRVLIEAHPAQAQKFLLLPTRCICPRPNRG